uniref:Bet v I/Major latex protein domain-containing protein n=1 Tax=Leersia perrieri TaxID=77586 RepID=A0A0D9WDR0_9ORYZ
MAAAGARRKVELEWKGRVTAAAPAATAQEAWARLSDFTAFHRWHPRVAKCRRVAGACSPRSPGCVRYCEGVPGVADAGAAAAVDWAHETLLEHDAAGMSLRYEMNDNNMGFGAFFATLSVVPGAGGGGGCELRWEFECEPVVGTEKEALAARLQDGIDGMARRVQEAVSGGRRGDGAAATNSGDVKLGTSIAV